MFQFLGRKRDCLWPTIVAGGVLVLTAAAVFGFGRAFLLSRPAVAVAELTLTEPLASAYGTEPPTPLQLKAIERWVAAQAGENPPAESALAQAFTVVGRRTLPDLSAKAPSQAELAATPADMRPTDNLETDPPNADSEADTSSDPLASKLDSIGLPSALTPEDDTSRAWLTVRTEYVSTQHAIAVMLTARAPRADMASAAVETASQRYARFASQRWWREAQAAFTKAEAELRAAQKDLKSAEDRLAEAIRRKEAFESASESAIESEWLPASDPQTSEPAPTGRQPAALSGNQEMNHQPNAEPEEPIERLSLGRQIEVLKLRRACLLWQLTPKHPQIESIDQQIADLESQLAELPPDSPLIWSAEGASPHESRVASGPPAPTDSAAGSPSTLGKSSQGLPHANEPAGTSPTPSGATVVELDARQLLVELAEATVAVEQAKQRAEQAEQHRQLCRFALNNPPQSTLGPLRVSDPNQLFRTLALWPLAALAGGNAVLFAALTYALLSLRIRRRRAAIVVTSVEQLEQVSPLPVIALAAAGTSPVAAR